MPVPPPVQPAFAASSGGLVTFHDADDAMTPDKLEVQVGHLLANPGVGVVMGEQEVIVEPGSELPFWVEGSSAQAAVPTRPAEVSDGPDVHVMTMLLRREIFVQVGPFDESIRPAEDIDWAMRAVEADIEIAKLSRCCCDGECIRRASPRTWPLCAPACSAPSRPGSSASALAPPAERAGAVHGQLPDAVQAPEAAREGDEATGAWRAGVEVAQAPVAVLRLAARRACAGARGADRRREGGGARAGWWEARDQSGEGGLGNGERRTPRAGSPVPRRWRR